MQHDARLAISAGAGTAVLPRTFVAVCCNTTAAGGGSSLSACVLTPALRLALCLCTVAASLLHWRSVGMLLQASINGSVGWRWTSTAPRQRISHAAGAASLDAAILLSYALNACHICSSKGLA